GGSPQEARAAARRVGPRSHLTGRRAVAGRGTASFAWHESRAHLIARTTVDMPGAPDTVSIIGCDAANGTYFQLYSDDRGVCRVYEMSIGDGEWKLWREGDPFPQRFAATMSEDGDTISGRWEKAEDGANYTTDFYLTYTRFL